MFRGCDWVELIQLHVELVNISAYFTERRIYLESLESGSTIGLEGSVFSEIIKIVEIRQLVIMRVPRGNRAIRILNNTLRSHIVSPHEGIAIDTDILVLGLNCCNHIIDKFAIVGLIF